MKAGIARTALETEPRIACQPRPQPPGQTELAHEEVNIPGICPGGRIPQLLPFLRALMAHRLEQSHKAGHEDDHPQRIVGEGGQVGSETAP